MSSALWVVVPYIVLTIFVVGHIWRWRHDQFGWTSRTTQLLESRLLRLGSPLFHLGVFMAIGGHVLGLCIPESWTKAIGISENVYHLVSVTAGTIAGAMVVVGLALLIARRWANPRVRLTTTTSDKVLFVLMSLTIILGVTATVGKNLLGGGYDYRLSVAVWFRDIFLLHPNGQMMANAPLIYQLHVIMALAFFAVWPFTRLVHVWSAPVAYLWRPYIVYRRRTPLRAGSGSQAGTYLAAQAAAAGAAGQLAGAASLMPVLASRPTAQEPADPHGSAGNGNGGGAVPVDAGAGRGGPG